MSDPEAMLVAGSLRNLQGKHKGSLGFYQEDRKGHWARDVAQFRVEFHIQRFSYLRQCAVVVILLSCYGIPVVCQAP